MNYRIQRRKKFAKRYNERLKNRFKKPIPRTIVPSFFTLMNLFCGFAALIQIYEGQLLYGAWLIVFAGLFDALDGFMARLTKSTSSFGIELDSLSDVVSFGVAPGFLMYAFTLSDISALAIIIVCALPALCGAVRLARFNLEAKENDTDFFKGLPIPAHAMMLVGFYLTFRNNLEFFDVFEYGVNSILIAMMIILSLLMVSTVPFDKIPRFGKKYARRHRSRIFLFTGYLLAILFLQEIGLLMVFVVFIGKGLIMSSVHYFRDIMKDDDNGNNGDDDLIVVLDR
ncbi:MAG: CDP-diacylglycerol--serine O-phosphatidyltransferase [Balneolaceae bacterium]|jgi:CDP-diacylglycerol--serine O-phosphatidyltransferase|nr:MAG: CDP-diacylglycerol--serine O-phosphatidyltransferase [Balneolaceae bacterium]